MMRGDGFLRAALLALDEAGDPTHVRGIVEAALARPAPVRQVARPAGVVKRVGWIAGQLAMVADDPARAYMRLRELCATLFDPLASVARAPAPAPEVALALAPVALLDALAPPPRVVARELAAVAELDTVALLADARPDRRVLGVRSIPSAKLGRYALLLAGRIASDPDPTVRAEAVATCARASGPIRTKIAAAITPHVDSDSADIRIAALDGLRALKLPLADAKLATLLDDPAPAVRAAAARSVLPACSATVGAAVISRLADADPAVRAAALDAIARCPALHRPALVAPLCALVRLHDGDTRTAIYLLGKLRARASAAEAELIVATLHDAFAGPRSDVARAAAIVLQQLGVPPREVSADARLLRAARELAAPDRETQLAGLFEAQRLGEAARPLIPAIRRLGEMLVAEEQTPAPHDASASRATLAQIRDVLTALGVPRPELPHTRAALAPYRDLAPRERSHHGAYTIAVIEAAATRKAPAIAGLGLWDRATGALLFVVENAELFELLSGRAEVGVLRIADDDSWHFERYAVPTGALVGTLPVPDTLTSGWPSSLAVAADLVTIWCGDEDEPYRFHIKLGDPDRLLDDEPNVGRKRERRVSAKLPRPKRSSRTRAP